MLNTHSKWRRVRIWQPSHSARLQTHHASFWRESMQSQKLLLEERVHLEPQLLLGQLEETRFHDSGRDVVEVD